MQLQKSYPRIPYFEISLIKFPLGDNEATATRRVLSDLNDSAFNRSFTDRI